MRFQKRRCGIRAIESLKVDPRALHDVAHEIVKDGLILEPRVAIDAYFGHVVRGLGCPLGLAFAAARGGQRRG
eukprot:2159180-Pyramimonas_sp.AAC.1